MLENPKLINTRLINKKIRIRKNKLIMRIMLYYEFIKVPAQKHIIPYIVSLAY